MQTTATQRRCHTKVPAKIADHFAQRRIFPAHGIDVVHPKHVKLDNVRIQF